MTEGVSQACSGGSDSDAIRRNAVARKVADWLALAASPIFAVMALLTGVLDGGEAEMAHTSQLTGMVTMYLLMSVFHAGAWLKLVRGGASSSKLYSDRVGRRSTVSMSDLPPAR